MNVGVELVGSGPRPINFGLSLQRLEASLLRRQRLPTGPGSKLVCLGGMPVGLDLGDVSQMPMLARLASQLVAMMGHAAPCHIERPDQNHEKSKDRGHDGERHCLPP
jgi:hypothetical protein